MNRRAAIAALMALPATARIARADVKADDVIVVECDHRLNQDSYAHITAQLRAVWPEPQRIIVLDSSLRLKVVAESALAP